MGTQSPAEVAKDVDEISKQAKAIMDEASKDLATYKKKGGEFETIRGGLIEGEKMIKEHLKELDTLHTTFDKMSIKLAGVRKDLETLGKSMADTHKMFVKLGPAIVSLGKDAEKLLAVNKGNALLAKAKTTCDTLDKTLGDTGDKLHFAVGDCQGLPGDITKPKA